MSKNNPKVFKGALIMMDLTKLKVKDAEKYLFVTKINVHQLWEADPSAQI